MPAQPSIEDKFTGAILGCAVGDALGAPVEGLSTAEISSRYGTIKDFIDERFGAGMVTDDTQMTVALAQSILDKGRFDLAHAAYKFGRWMQLADEGIKEARGAGMASATACRSLYRGTPPEEAGLPSAGCGAAMRVGPIGLRYYDDLAALKKAAIEQSMLTHTDPEAVAGAVAVALAVALGIDGPAECDVLSTTSEFVRDISPGMAEKVSGIQAFISAPVEEGFAHTGTGGYVMETVPAALLAFARTPADFETTIITAVNAGGDTDSVAAIAGAVSGAFNGVGAIPTRWLDGVEGGEYLESVAKKLLSLTPGYKPTYRIPTL